MIKTTNSYARIKSDTQDLRNKGVSIEELTEEQLNGELEKGYVDMLEGRVQPAEVVFAEMNEEYDFAAQGDKRSCYR